MYENTSWRIGFCNRTGIDFKNSSKDSFLDSVHSWKRVFPKGTVTFPQEACPAPIFPWNIIVVDSEEVAMR